MATDKHEQVRRRAYEIWEDEGRPEGAAFRHWLQASDELSEGDEPETMQNLIDEDDMDDLSRDERALLQGAGYSGDLDGSNRKRMHGGSTWPPGSQSEPCNTRVRNSGRSS